MTFTSKITWIKSSWFFNLFLTSKCFVLFELFFYKGSLVEYQNLSLLLNLACASLAAKFSAVNLLNPKVVIYLS